MVDTLLHDSKVL